MRILHSVPNIGRISAGPSYSIVGLCRSLSKSIELELVSLDKKELETSLHFLRTFPSNKIMNKLGVSKQLKKYFLVKVHLLSLIYFMHIVFGCFQIFIQSNQLLKIINPVLFLQEGL